MAEARIALMAGPTRSVEKNGPQTQGEFDTAFDNLATRSAFEDIIAREYGEDRRSTGETPTTVADLKDDLVVQAVEHSALEKTKELAQLLEDPADRRRGLAAIYGEETVRDMSDADVEAFIAEKTAEPTTAEATSPTPERPATPRTEAPQGFPTRQEAEAELREQSPVRLSFMKRARLALGAPGRMIWKGYSKLFDKAASRSERYNNMTPEAQEKLKKRVGILSTLGAAAIATLAYHMKVDNMVHFAGGSTATTAAAEAQPQAAVEGPKNRVRSIEEYPTFQHDRRMQEFVYNPNDPLDPMNNVAREQYNFGAQLNLESAEAARDDLLEGLKHNPMQLAAAMGNFGLIPNNQGSIENVAGLMRDNPEVMMSNYDQVRTAAIGTPVSLTAEQTASYGTYSAISNNGNTILTYQNASDTQPFLVFHTPQGEACFGGKCRQPVFLSGPAAEAGTPARATSNAPVQHAVGSRPSQAQGGGTQPVPGPGRPQTGGGNPGGPQPGGENPGGSNPGGGEPGPGNPNDGKDFSGGVPAADGIDPSQNQFLGITPAPEVTGNGTGSPNLAAGPQPGGESHTQADGAQANTDQQVEGMLPGATTNWEDSNAQAQAAQAAQAAADAAARAAEQEMSRPGAVDAAIDGALAGMGADGRPAGTGGSTGGTAGGLAGLGTLGTGGSAGGGGGSGFKLPTGDSGGIAGFGTLNNN